MKEPQKITLELIVSQNEKYYDMVNCDFLTRSGKRLRGFGIPNPCIMPLEITEICGFDASADTPSEEFDFDAYKVVVEPTPTIYCNNQLIASFATEAEANIACRALNINRAKQAFRKNVEH